MFLLLLRFVRSTTLMPTWTSFVHSVNKNSELHNKKKSRTTLTKRKNVTEIPKPKAVRQEQRFSFNKSNSKIETFLLYRVLFFCTKSFRLIEQTKRFKWRSEYFKSAKTISVFFFFRNGRLDFFSAINNVEYTILCTSFLMPFFSFGWAAIHTADNSSNNNNNNKNSIAIIFYYISMSDARFCHH